MMGKSLYKMLSCPLRGRQIYATVPKAQQIFFGSAMGQLELKLGSVATRGGSV
jgi:hypothetical protein